MGVGVFGTATPVARTVEHTQSEYWTVHDLCARFACSRMWITRAIHHRDFPHPIKFGDGVGVRRRWLVREVIAWERKYISGDRRAQA